MKIAFLIVDRDHIGGVVSATHNLAGALAAGHEVEVAALRRARTESAFPLDPRVRVVDLTDVRPVAPSADADDPLAEQWPRVYPEDRARKTPKIGRLAEIRLLRYLEDTDADVVVSSNPKITVLLDAVGPRPFLKLAQEHSHPWGYDYGLRDKLYAAYHGMDAVTVLTPEVSERLGAATGRTHFMPVLPNCVPALDGAPESGGAPLIVTGGTLRPHKGFDLLIEAFARVAGEFPDWRLRIHGSGPEKEALRGLIEERGLGHSVLLMGATERLPWEFAKGAVFVLPSRREPFGNVVVEAMSVGLPVVSTDCDHGPRNILTPGEEGFLVPKDDPEAMADALRPLMADPDLRASMGAAARAGAARFGEEAAAARFTEIIEQAAARRAGTAEARLRVSGGGDVEVEVAGAPEGADLVLSRITDGDGPVVVPLLPAPDGVRAVIARKGGVPEGDWKATLRGADGSVVPLRALSCDASVFLGAPRLSREAPGIELLYPSIGAAGAPMLRSRVRPVHAETARVHPRPDGIEIRGGVWGGALCAGAVVEAVDRSGGDCSVSAAAEPDPDGGAEAFRAVLPVAGLVALYRGEDRVWDLWLRPAPGADRVGLCRLDTDITAQTSVFAHPRLHFTEKGRLPRGGGRRCEVRTYFSSADRLAVKVTKGG